MKFVIISILFFVSPIFGCLPGLQYVKTLQAIYKDVPCIQCPIFNVASTNDKVNYSSLAINATNGLVLPVFELTPEHCAVVTFNCYPNFDEVAFFATNSNNSSNLTVLSQPANARATAKIRCNNESLWEYEDSNSTLPSNNFTLHCISSKEENLNPGIDQEGLEGSGEF